jgi:hypothetical protein
MVDINSQVLYIMLSLPFIISAKQWRGSYYDGCLSWGPTAGYQKWMDRNKPCLICSSLQFEHGAVLETHPVSYGSRVLCIAPRFIKTAIILEVFLNSKVEIIDDAVEALLRLLNDQRIYGMYLPGCLVRPYIIFIHTKPTRSHFCHCSMSAAQERLC